MCANIESSASSLVGVAPFISCKKDLCRNHFNRNSKPLKSYLMSDFLICIFVSLIDCVSLKGLILVVCLWPYRLACVYM